MFGEQNLFRLIYICFNIFFLSSIKFGSIVFNLIIFSLNLSLSSYKIEDHVTLKSLRLKYQECKLDIMMWDKWDFIPCERILNPLIISSVYIYQVPKTSYNVKNSHKFLTDDRKEYNISEYLFTGCNKT